MMSRTSNTHTIASIEPYEIGQDRSEAITAPCIVLTVSLGSNSSHNTAPAATAPPKFKRDLSAAAVLRCWSIVQARRRLLLEATRTSLHWRYDHDARGAAMVQD